MMTEKTNLICLPHAGGYADGYSKLKHYLDNNIEQILVEYPGHGRKHREPLLTSLEELVDFVYNEIKPYLNTKYAVYGHSMGGRIAWLVSHRLRELNLPQPIQLFISGCPAPSAPFMSPDDVDFRTIFNLSGPGMDALREMFEPIIQADLKAVDDYQYETKEPLSVPITVCYGLEDDFPVEDFLKWDIETTHKIDSHEFQGDHFFNFKNFDRIGEIINQTLR
ncbi:MAG: alpha/beta fold hydrolase [Candidatus Hatepunaea meridiana]|nr:alpha/beta fold hydrolase [Candidatus Hatepunaea meridiana]